MDRGRTHRAPELTASASRTERHVAGGQHRQPGLGREALEHARIAERRGRIGVAVLVIRRRAPARRRTALEVDALDAAPRRRRRPDRRARDPPRLAEAVEPLGGELKRVEAVTTSNESSSQGRFSIAPTRRSASQPAAGALDHALGGVDAAHRRPASAAMRQSSPVPQPTSRNRSRADRGLIEQHSRAGRRGAPSASTQRSAVALQRGPSRPRRARPLAPHAGVIGLRRSEKRAVLALGEAKRRISSARRSSGSITASMTSSEARWRMSMSAEYSSRLARDELLALGLVVDRLDLVEEDRVDRRLGPHHGDRGAGQGDAAVGLERRPGHRVEAGAVGLADDHRELRHGRLGDGADHLRAVADDPLALDRRCRS